MKSAAQRCPCRKAEADCRCHRPVNSPSPAGNVQGPDRYSGAVLVSHPGRYSPSIPSGDKVVMPVALSRGAGSAWYLANIRYAKDTPYVEICLHRRYMMRLRDDRSAETASPGGFRPVVAQGGPQAVAGNYPLGRLRAPYRFLSPLCVCGLRPSTVAVSKPTISIGPLSFGRLAGSKA